MKDSAWLWLIGGGALVYFLMPEKVKEVAGGVIGGGGGLGTVLREAGERIIQLPGEVITIPGPREVFTEVIENVGDVVSESGEDVINEGKRMVENVTEDWINDVFNFPEDIFPKSPEQPTEGMLPGEDETPVDFTALGDRMIETMQRAGGILGRQYVGAAITGTHLVKPLPLAAKIEQTFPKLLRVTPKAGAKVGTKIASKAIPVIGWASLGADIVADVARLFGADVTEWLGISSLAEPFLGYNPLEKWVGGYEERQALASGPIDKWLTYSEGSSYPPESPTRYSEGTTPVVSDRVTAGRPTGGGYSPVVQAAVERAESASGWWMHIPEL